LVAIRKLDENDGEIAQQLYILLQEGDGVVHPTVPPLAHILTNSLRKYFLLLSQNCPINRKSTSNRIVSCSAMHLPIFRYVDQHVKISADPLSGSAVGQNFRKASLQGKRRQEGDHSLRAGFVTEAAKRGARLDQIMKLARGT
jgi:hypothetical protein